MTAIEEKMLGWLESGTPEQKDHAAARFAIGFTAADAPTPAQVQPEWAPAWPACAYRESCACTGGAPICYHPANGGQFGHASTLLSADGSAVPVRRVLMDDCISCRAAADTAGA